MQKLINRNLNQIESKDQKGELSWPVMMVLMAEPRRKKDTYTFLTRTQPMKSHELF